MTSQTLRHTIATRTAPIVLVVFATTVAVMSWNLDLGALSRPGPGLWPFTVSLVMLGASLAMTAGGTDEKPEPFTRRSLLVAIGVLSLAGYIVAFATLGYLIPTAAVLLVWLRLLARESWVMAIGLTVLLTAGFYVLFVSILAVPFPPGALPVP